MEAPQHQFISVSSYLREKLTSYQKTNPRYSLRAFALKIGISPGGLVQIFSGQKKLSVERAYEIANHLKLDDQEKRFFLLATEYEQAKAIQRKSEVLEQIRELQGDNGTPKGPFYDLSVDQFYLISEWYGLAILECVSGHGKNFTEAEIAKYFNLSTSQVVLTLERLQRLLLIERRPSGGWARIKGRLLVNSHIPNEAIREHYLSVLKMAMESITTQTPQEKVSATEVFNFDVSDLAKVKKMTDEYLESLQALSKKGKNQKNTYQTVVNVFRLDQNNLNVISKSEKKYETTKH